MIPLAGIVIKPIDQVRILFRPFFIPFKTRLRLGHHGWSERDCKSLLNCDYAPSWCRNSHNRV